jgi:hypothetical protein
MERRIVFCDACEAKITMGTNYLQVCIDKVVRHFDSISCLAKFVKEQSNLDMFAGEDQISGITLMKMQNNKEVQK